MRSIILSLTFLLLVSPAWAGSAPKKQKSASTKKATVKAGAKKAGAQANANTNAEDLTPQFDLESSPVAKGPVREKKYFYSSFGTRDPFRSLVSGTFQARANDVVDLHTVELVGVLWEDQEFIGIVQDGQGYGWDLRPGDRVRNGTIVSITKDTLIARLSLFGHTSRVTLRLKSEVKE